MANEFKVKKGLIVSGSGGTLLDVQGSVGQVFSVTDSLTGDIFSVSDVSGIPIFNVNSDGTVTIDGNIQLADNDKIQLGDDQDLELYHDGTHSYISDNGTGELRFIANGATRFKIGSDVASFSGTDFAIAAGRKLYLDGQSNTYITESSSDTIKIFTGGSEVLELANNAATFAGAISTPTGSTFAGAIKITETGTAQHILIGNQDSGGTNKPAMIQGVNGQLNLGFGSSWSSEGGTMTDTLSLDVSNNATFAGSITAGTGGQFRVLGSGYIQLGNCTISKSGDSNHIHVDCPTALIPNSTTLANNTRLGTSSYRWQNFYSGPGNFEGSVTASADVIAYSDARLKENVKTLDGSKVLQMRGVSFDRKDTGISSSGVIAQEMQKVAPELVSNDDGTLGVAYGNLTGYLIEAIKEQQKQINELKSQMAACNKIACNCKN
jgi:hypothetical protein